MMPHPCNSKQIARLTEHGDLFAVHQHINTGTGVECLPSTVPVKYVVLCIALFSAATTHADYCQTTDKSLWTE